jgi:hypothetical protein
MNNVHDDEPIIFQTRWALSYLRGPLTRAQIQTLMQPRKAIAVSAAPTSMPTMQPRTTGGTGGSPTSAEAASSATSPPLVPATITQRYLRSASQNKGARIVYRPALCGSGRLHFVKAGVTDVWRDVTLLADCRNGVADDVWGEAEACEKLPPLAESPQQDATFAELPPQLTRAASYKSWTSAFKSHLYQGHDLTLFQCKTLKENSKPGESEGDFRARLRQRAVEARDLAIAKLRQKYATKLATAQNQIRTAEEKVAREKQQSRESMMQAGTSIFTTVIGAMFGRKIASATNLGRAGSAMRNATRAAGQRGDIGRAEDTLGERQEKLEDLEKELEGEIEQIKANFQPDALTLDEIVILPRKSDIEVGDVMLVWAPWTVDANGIAEPAYSLT